MLSGTSDSDPQRWFYQHGGEDARSLWLSTPYAGWDEVMPSPRPCRAGPSVYRLDCGRSAG
ncbi:hypothetical protein P4S72_10855 [Vibrio sp. PP-XX7]